MGRQAAGCMGIAAALALAVPAAVIVATARPGDQSLWPAPPGVSTVTIRVVNHGYHAGIVVPRASAEALAKRQRWTALSAVTERFAPYAWLEIGWGEEAFYRSTPTAASLNVVARGLRALFSPHNKAVLHVVGLHQRPETVVRDSDLLRIDLSEAGFVRMLARIDASIARGEDGRPQDLGDGLYGASRFFAANGRFHIFRVCNHWVADLLDAAGLPTAPALSALPHGLLFDLRWRAGLVPVGRPS